MGCPGFRKNNLPVTYEKMTPQSGTRLMLEEIKSKYGFNSPRVFKAMSAVPRTSFVSPKRRHYAYRDMALPISHGQTISQPYTVAFMTHLLKLKGNERVLELGTGSGYQAAVLSHLAREVYSIERLRPLAQKAKARLLSLNYKNVHVKWGRGELGWPAKAPFDAIIITAQIQGEIPKVLKDQLKDGGIIVAPVNETMLRLTKKVNKFKTESFGSFRFVPFVKASPD